MVIDMNESRLTTMAQLRAFLKGSLEVEFKAASNDVERYGFISTVLQRFRYYRLSRSDKGVVLRYLERTTGYSRHQLTRLVGRCRDGPSLAKRYRARLPWGDISPESRTLGSSTTFTSSGASRTSLMGQHVLAWVFATEIPARGSSSTAGAGGLPLAQPGR